MIRAATPADVPALVALGREFRASSDYAAHVQDNPDQIAAMFTHLVTSPEGVMFVADAGSGPVGMIGLLLFRHHFSAALVAGELVWYCQPSTPGQGIRLLKRAERWAQDAGATQITMVQPVWNARVGELYGRLGYDRLEVAWQKAVPA